MKLPFTGCIERIYSVSAVLGGPGCNANCPGCAGRVLRDDAAKVRERGGHNKAPRNIVAASRLCLNYGGWSLALTGSGEPTCYPRAITDTLETLKNEDVRWPFINLFTNGIRLANEKEIQDNLRHWKKLGLTSVALSVHSVDDDRNRAAYGNPKQFYRLADAIGQVKAAGLCCRIVLLLGRENVGTLAEYKRSLDHLHDLGIGLITSWEMRHNNGRRSKQTPKRREMLKIRCWLMARTTAVMGHIWGGAVRSYRGMNIRLTDYVSPHRPWNDYVRQLVVLPGGKVSYSWYQPGMFCLE
jgi:MoaA/NifB/PqqE/SkfB family radical SAM enzyme